MTAQVDQRLPPQLPPKSNRRQAASALSIQTQRQDHNIKAFSSSRRPAELPSPPPSPRAGPSALASASATSVSPSPSHFDLPAHVPVQSLAASSAIASIRAQISKTVQQRLDEQRGTKDADIHKAAKESRPEARAHFGTSPPLSADYNHTMDEPNTIHTNDQTKDMIDAIESHLAEMADIRLADESPDVESPVRKASLKDTVKSNQKDAGVYRESFWGQHTNRQSVVLDDNDYDLAEFARARQGSEDSGDSRESKDEFRNHSNSSKIDEVKDRMRKLRVRSTTSTTSEEPLSPALRDNLQHPDDSTSNSDTTRSGNDSSAASDHTRATSPSLSAETIPDLLTVQLTSIDLQARPLRNATVHLRLTVASTTMISPEVPLLEDLYPMTFEFPFVYHNVLFDALKMDVIEKRKNAMGMHENLLGRLGVKLSAIDQAKRGGNLESEFVLETKSYDPVPVGSCRLKLGFTRQDEIKPMSQQNRAATMPVPKHLDHSETFGEIRMTKVDSIDVVAEKHHLAESVVGSVLNQETRDALHEIMVLYHSFFSTGWRMSKQEFFKAYTLLEEYYDLQKSTSGSKNQSKDGPGEEAPSGVDLAIAHGGGPAGWIQRHRRQKKEERLQEAGLDTEAIRQNLTQHTGEIVHDTEALEWGHRYLKFAMGCYGSFLFQWFGYGQLKKTAINLARKDADRKAVRDYFGLANSDMLLWHYGHNAPGQPSFYIVRDPVNNAIVIAVRGTWNLADLVTDANAAYETVPGLSNGPAGMSFVHRGVHRCAHFVVEKAMTVIETALQEFKANSIICTGHSLGAGVSALVALLLDDRLAPRGIHVKSINFAPVPVVSWNIATSERAQRIVENYVNEHDLVPRLSWGNAVELKELVKTIVEEDRLISLEKKQAEQKRKEPNKLRRRGDQVEEPKVHNKDSRKARILAKVDAKRREIQESQKDTKLFITGTVYYFYKAYNLTGEKKGSYSKDIMIELSHPSYFADLRLQPRWIQHHWPDRIDHRFRAATRFLNRAENETQAKGTAVVRGGGKVKWQRVNA